MGRKKKIKNRKEKIPFVYYKGVSDLLEFSRKLGYCLVDIEYFRDLINIDNGYKHPLWEKTMRLIYDVKFIYNYLLYHEIDGDKKSYREYYKKVVENFCEIQLAWAMIKKDLPESDKEQGEVKNIIDLLEDQLISCSQLLGSLMSKKAKRTAGVWGDDW